MSLEIRWKYWITWSPKSHSECQPWDHWSSWLRSWGATWGWRRGWRWDKVGTLLGSQPPLHSPPELKSLYDCHLICTDITMYLNWFSRSNLVKSKPRYVGGVKQSPMRRAERHLYMESMGKTKKTWEGQREYEKDQENIHVGGWVRKVLPWPVCPASLEPAWCSRSLWSPAGGWRTLSIEIRWSHVQCTHSCVYHHWLLTWSY